MVIRYLRNSRIALHLLPAILNLERVTFVIFTVVAELPVNSFRFRGEFMYRLIVSKKSKATLVALLIVAILAVFGYFFHMIIIDWIYMKFGFNVTRDIASIVYILIGGVAFKVCCKALHVGY